jgi:hypothetical protein
MPVPPPKVTVTGALPKAIVRWLTPEEAHQQRTEAKRPLPLDGKRPLTWVGVAGFEPAASSSRTKRATKLRHTPPARNLNRYRTRLG